MKELKNSLHAFIIGSSLVSVIISYTYIGLSNMQKKIIKQYEFFPLGISLLFGFYNIVNYFIYQKLGNDNSAIISGILMGLTLSSIGRFIFDLPIRLFDFSKKNEYTVHLYAMTLYSMIFYFIIQNLNKMYLL